MCGDEAKPFYLAKYFPSSGWYTHTRKADDDDPHAVRLLTEEEFTQEFNRWLGQHIHYSNNGEFLKLEYE
jgi:hypothetical protein